MKRSQLHITWEDRHRDFALQGLAEMQKMSEVADSMLREFAAEWHIVTQGPDGKPDAAGIKRMVNIRAWVYDRVRFMNLDKRMEKWQVEIARRRAEWLKNIKDRYRLANKAARIDILEKLIEAAQRDKHYHAAIRGVLAIAQELGELKIPVEHSGTFVHRHYDVTKLTNEQLRRIAVDGENPLLVVPEWGKQ